MRIVGKIDYECNIKINPLELDFSKFNSPQCDHCKTNHKRKFTYVVELDNGELIQVGRACLKNIFDFGFGCEEEELDVVDYDSTEMLEHLFCGYSKKSDAYTARGLLNTLIHFNKAYGFENKSFDTYYRNPDFITYINSLSIEDKNEVFAEVETVIQWYEQTKLYNDFQNNIKNMIIDDFVEKKYINIFKYAYKVYKDSINYQAPYNSVKVDYKELTIESVEFIDRNFYTYAYKQTTETKVYRIIDTNKNVFSYETATNIVLNVGDKIKFRHKSTYESKKFGVVNKINYVKIIS